MAAMSRRWLHVSLLRNIETEVMIKKTAFENMRPNKGSKKVNNLKKRQRESILLEHVKYCCSVSSLHGLNHIVWSNRSPLERLLWICVVVGFTIFGILKSYEIFQHQQERPSMITVELDYRNWKSEFPSVVVCQLELEEKYLKAYNITKGSEMYEYLEDLAFKDYNTYYEYEKYANGSKKELLKPEQYLEVLLQAVPTLGEDAVTKTQFPFGKKLPLPTIITELGICSTVNPSNGIYYTPEYFNSSAPYEFEPVLYDFIGSTLKCDIREFVYRIKAAVTSANEMVDIVSRMYYFAKSSLSTFTTSSISVFTPKSVKDLRIHQRNCRLFDEAEDLEHSPKYTPKLCQIECRIKLCLKYCNCTPYYYRRNPGENICDMTGMYCLSKYAEELVNVADHSRNGSTCFCLQNCDSLIVLTEDISSANFIAEGRLTIQVRAHSDIRYIRKLIFTKLDLIVQIGGILGLCLGCTILGIIEVVYFMSLRFYWGVIRGMSIKSSL